MIERLREGDDVLKKLHGKEYQLQIDEAERLGLGVKVYADCHLNILPGILTAGHISNGLRLCNVAASDPVHSLTCTNVTNEVLTLFFPAIFRY